MSKAPAIPLQLDTFTKAILVLLVVIGVIIIIQRTRPVRVELSTAQPLGLLVKGVVSAAVAMASPVKIELPQPAPAATFERRKIDFIGEPADEEEV